MKKIKEYLNDLVAPFLLMLLLGALFTVLLHFASIWLFKYNMFLEKEPDKRLDDFIKIVGVAVSITGFISIILTIIQSKKGIQREIQKNTIDLCKEFRSEKIKTARDRTWDVKERWGKDENYKKAYLKFNFGNPDNLKDDELSKDTNFPSSGNCVHRANKVNIFNEKRCG